MVRIKICGINDGVAMRAALAAGADMVGLVFFPPSPRHLTLETAVPLAALARGTAEIVALTVDADDELVDTIAAQIAPDYIQLHGRESLARTREIGVRTGAHIIKAFGVASPADIDATAPFVPHISLALLDARPPPEADRPGGHGAAFDWAILEPLDPAFRYMLSGGLTVDNVGEAIRRLRPFAVDVSSGVEQRPGRKDPEMIAEFVRAAREASET